MEIKEDMSYQALYRKFRPDTFRDVKGQDSIVTTLKNQIKSGRIGHAYLFCGTRGTGKTTVAKVFAKTVNCEKPVEGGPCGECEMCHMIGEGRSMNVVEIDAASNNRVDDIRQVIEEVQYSPAQGKYKVYIVDEVHMLSTSAFNALLKTLEEPPSYLIFILATTEVQKIPMTILSRCQRYDFKRISVDTIAKRLKELLDREGTEAEDRALRYIGKMADGAMRDGLSLLEQCVSFYIGEKLTYDHVLQILGAVDYEVYDKFVRSLLEDDVLSVMSLLDQIVLEGKDLSQFMVEFVWYLRNLLLTKASEEVSGILDVSDENLTLLKATAELFELEIIFRYIRVVSDLINQLRYASSKRILVEVTMIKLCRPQMESDHESLIQRIEFLERKVEKGVAIVHEKNPEQDSSLLKKEQTKRELPKAIPEELEQVARNWDVICRELEQVDQGMMSGVKLTVGGNNCLILAFQEETPACYFADFDKKQGLESLISNKIGKEVKIEVRAAKSDLEYDSLPEIRDMFHISKKVKIEFNS